MKARQNYSEICGNKPRYNEQILTVPMHNLPCYNDYMYFVLSLAVRKNGMIQMVDRPNMTPIGQDREIFELQSFALFKCSCSRASLYTDLHRVYPIVQLGPAW